MKKIYNFVRTNFFYFITYAFLGWVYEVMWFIIMRNKFVNRGFLHGPYLPIYGFGFLILLFMLKKLKEKKIKVFKINITPILIFVAIFIITTVIEFISHYILDTYFGIILWDYSKDYLNIDGRVCFAASRNFAIGGTLGFYLVQPIIDKVLNKLKDKTKTIIFIPLFIIVIIDLLVTIL